MTKKQTKTNLLSIPLKDLFLSEHNVRTVKSSKGDDKILRSLIAANGVKQNLVVHKEGDKYGVFAGGRRYKQLEILRKEKVINGNYLVPCMVEPLENITAVSLAENIGRVSMHPADEFLAFNKLIEEGRTVVEVAHQFGTSQVNVKKRMKLACLSMVIINHFREGHLTLDQVIAFTLSDDHDKQIACYKELSPNHLSTHRIKGMLTEDAVTTDHPLMPLVTLKAYRKAGGTITDDLFSDKTYVNDADILMEIADKLLTDEANKIIEAGWKWADIALDQNNYDDFQTRITAEFKGVPKELSQKLSALEEERENLQLIDYEEWTDKDEEKEIQIDEEIEKLEEKREQYRDFSPEQKVVSGVLVTHNHGEIIYDFGLVKKEDMLLAFPPNESEQTSDSQAVDTDNHAESAALKTDLANFKLQAIQSELMKDDKLTYDLMVFSHVKKVFTEDCWASLPLAVQITVSDLGSTQGIDETCSYKAIDAFKMGLSMDWLSQENEKKQFAEFRALSSVQKKRLLSYCTALSYRYGNINGVDELIFETIKFDMSQHWKPTKDNYFNRVTKPTLLDIGDEMIGGQWKEDHAKSKKGVLADLLEADDAMQNWMPKSFR